MPKNRVVLEPQYFNKFSCTGDKCEDSCCCGWKIDVDKKSYEKYRKVSDNELKLLLDKNVKRNRSNATEENYAKINLDDKGLCPLLDENKLCRIHKDLGAGYLSKVCNTYPRVTNLIDQNYEKSVTLSCPEAARLILLNPQLMEFDEVEETAETPIIIQFAAETNDLRNAKRVIKYFWQLRIFSISLVQNRRYKLWERLIILGLFMQKVSEYSIDDTVDKIPQLIDQYNEIIDSEFLKNELANIPINLNIQMELMKEINDQRFGIRLNAHTNVYVSCVVEFLNGIKYIKDDKVEDIAERYKEAFHNYYKPFMDEHEYILENYVVNHIFKGLFPILSKGDVFQEYVKLIVNYSYIKTLLIGIAGFHQKLDEDIIIKLIYSFSRAIEHNKVFQNDMLNIIKSNDFDTMPYMSILIKN